MDFCLPFFWASGSGGSPSRCLKSLPWQKEKIEIWKVIPGFLMMIYSFYIYIYIYNYYVYILYIYIWFILIWIKLMKLIWIMKSQEFLGILCEQIPNFLRNSNPPPTHPRTWANKFTLGPSNDTLEPGKSTESLQISVFVLFISIFNVYSVHCW